MRLATDPVAERDLMTANHLSGFYLRKGQVDDAYATVRLWSFPDQGAAEVVHAGLAQLDEAAGNHPFASGAVPDAACSSVPSGTVDVLRCRIQAGEFVAAVSVNDPDGPAAEATMDQLLVDELDLIDG